MKGFKGKFHIHPVFWIVFGTGILTGQFWDVITVFFIVIVHEMGHALAALKFGWRLTSVELLPFGGVAKVDEHGTRSFKEELIVTLAGPFQHLWLPLVSHLLLMTPYWNEANHAMFIERNEMILIFNLLPIWPLDGGKIIMLIFSKRFPYRLAYRYSLLCSLLFLVVLSVWIVFLQAFLLNFFIIAGFLTFTIINEWRHQRYVFMRFLLERWRDSKTRSFKEKTLLVTPETTLTEILEGFYKDKLHRIVVKGPTNHKEIDEKLVLEAYFNRHLYHHSIGHLLV
ncbi:stage IV sporulation protein FB [Pullulanibacillus pueri]|uniref:Stage IV sporulation protein FB n=1 Tax=Pullulanibacillus pueri TaxID=1437324 RepID=A0A8J3ENX7_9BACL|nr:M50 family metallopeptidase [Pullulanibacillus pueri]MBM7683286.1 stage IV sporulation protein FB [Pullulanibacillus pueri]GGH85835.1 stage IV sporulation protein FB [Pullulanibacillus pueri]